MAKLRTPELEKLLKAHPLYSQDGKKAEALVICKFFLGSITWYVIEGSEEENDYILYGLTCNDQAAEFGYTSLNEMEGVEIETEIEDGTGQDKGSITLEIERDKYFSPITLRELAKEDETVKRKLASMEYI